MQNNYSDQELTYAGFWVRLAAYCLDSILVFLVLLVVRLFLSGIMSLLSGTPLGGCADETFTSLFLVLL